MFEQNRETEIDRFVPAFSVAEMKSSIKFREEKGPLLRAKVPFNIGPIPLSSGIAVGTKKDLSVHVGTFFSAGPSIKLAFKPNEQNPLSVILKTGLGLSSRRFVTHFNC